jgi:2Fe-2S ferredoxin
MLDAANPSCLVLIIDLGEAAEGGLKAACGETLLTVLRRAETGIRHICGGRCACGTCRIALESDWALRLPAPSRNEARLLGVLPGASPAHRLACQITLDEQTDGLAFRLDTPVSRPLAGAQSTKPMETGP